MESKDRIKEQLIQEVEKLRQRIKELEASNERGQAGKILRESEDKFKNLADQSPNIIFIYKKDRIAYANKKCEEIMGYKREEFYALDFDFRTLIAPESREKIEAAFERHMKGEDVEPYEYTIVTRDGRRIEVINTPKLIMFEGESAVLGIVTDITERKLSEERLKETKNHLDNIIESSLDGIVVSDSMGNITRVNKSFLKLVGYEEKEIIGKHIMELSLIEKGTYNSTTDELVKIDEGFFNNAKSMTYEKLFKEGKIINWETYYLRKDKKVVPVEQNIVYLKNDERTLIGSVGIVRDITERRKVEHKIKEASEFLKNVFKTSLEGIIVTDSQGKITMVNEATAKMLGYSQDELVGMSTVELGPKGDIYVEVGKEFITQLLEKGFVLGEERTWLRKDGSLFNLEINSALLKDKDGNITGAVSSIRDITERKKIEGELRAINQQLMVREQELNAINQQLQASNQQLRENEQALRESKGRYHDLIESANAGIIMVENEKIIKVNRKTEEFYGYSRDELIGQSPRILTPEKYWKKHHDMLNGYLKSAKVSNMVFEEEGIRKDGSLFPIEISFSLSEKGENSITNIAVMRDITERKKSEKALRESEERYRLSAEYIPLHLGAIDQYGKFILWNKYSEKMLGYTADEVIGKMSPHTVHESEEDAEEVIRIASASGMYDKEINFVHKNKSVVPVHFVVVPKKTENGEITGFYGFAEDITARKKAEEAIRKSEQKYQSLIESANDAIISVNIEGVIVDCNKKAGEMFGYSCEEELVGKPIFLLSHPDDLDRQKGILEKFRKSKELSIRGKIQEVRGVRKNGEEFYYEGSVFITEVQGQHIITSIMRDISERKKAEKEIKEAKEFLEHVIESSKDGIIITDEKGHILSVNTAIEEMSGFKKEELVGEHPSIFIEDKDEMKKILEKTAELFKKGFTFYLEFGV
jgi:PAS domain S-box-containing protein